MKKIPIIALILVIALMFYGVSPMAVEPDGADVTEGCRGVRAKVPLGTSERLAETADAVLLYELNTDTFVYGWNVDGRIDPTGMVKLLTVLVALENGNLNDEVTVKRSTLNTVAIGSVSANLQAGEVIKLRDLLYCIMVASANDACAVAAEHIAGSQSAFVEMMNAKATQLGCTGSSFENVHGLSGTGQYTTARDLAIITENALENTLFHKMFCAEVYTVPATNKSEERYLVTTNYMMSDSYTSKHLDSRLTGGKTAAATLTDRSLICTAEVGDSRYLSIVMSADAKVSDNGFVVLRYGSFEETRALLDYGFQHFAVRQVVNARQTYDQYSVFGGENDISVKVSKDLYTLLPKDFSIEQLRFDAIMDANALQAPIAADSVLGTLQIRYQNIVLGNYDLVAMYAVAAKDSVISEGERLEQPEPEKVDYGKILLIVGCVLGGIVVLAAIVLVSIRLVKTIHFRRMRRRRLENRRRSQ